MRNAAVLSYGLIAKSGLHRFPIFHRIFLTFYAIYKKHFEAGPIERLRDFVPSGSLVIDVGANVGFFSIRFAKWVGKGGKVIAIEPEDRNYDSLVSALKRNDLLDRVYSLKAVAADAPGKLLLEINPLHPADHKLSRDGTGLPVNAVILDELVQVMSHLTPALVKIDVQGAEMLVLKGAASILKNTRPALFIELHEEGLSKFGTSVSAILDHLSEYGYQAYRLVRTGAHRKTSATEIYAKIARIGYIDVLFLSSRS